MVELLLQSAELLTGDGLSTTVKVITYILTGGAGALIFKFFKQWLSYRSDNEDRNLKASENLVDNLEQRIKSLTDRVVELEAQGEKAHQREIEMTKLLAKAEQKVETLEGKVKTLERNQKVLEETVDKYYKKFGPLDETTQGN